MKVIDNRLLNEFRKKKVCEFCGEFITDGCDPHHILARGQGGGGRLDVRINLIGLCPYWQGNDCHRKAQANRIKRDVLLAIVARRERRKLDEVIAELNQLRRVR